MSKDKSKKDITKKNKMGEEIEALFKSHQKSKSLPTPSNDSKELAEVKVEKKMTNPKEKTIKKKEKSKSISIKDDHFADSRGLLGSQSISNIKSFYRTIYRRRL